MAELKLKTALILTEDTEEKITQEGKVIIVKPIYKWLLQGGMPILRHVRFAQCKLRRRIWSFVGVIANPAFRQGEAILSMLYRV